MTAGRRARKEVAIRGDPLALAAEKKQEHFAAATASLGQSICGSIR